MGRKICFAGCVLPFLIFAVVPAPLCQEFAAKVIEVETGAVLKVRYHGAEAELTLYGIECPSPDEPLGQEALRFTSNTALEKEVRIRVRERKTPLRITGSVVLPDGTLLSHRLVQNGLAKWDRRAAPNDIKLQSLEDSARKLGVGLWSGSARGSLPSPDAKKERSVRTGPSRALYWVALSSMILALIGAVAVAAFFALKAGRSRHEARRAPPAPAVGTTEPSAEEAQSQEQAEAIESGREAVQELLQSLSEFVSDLMKKSMSYDTQMKDHRVSIDRAMTMAGLEEIKRLLVREIETMESTNESYRRQLDHANAKIQDQQEIMERFRIDSKMDFLTQIANRRAFETRLEEEFERAKRYGSTFAMLMIDIDHFKKVNDVHGHMAGDKVLRLVAQVLEDQTRFNDFVSRYGGEEFAVLLPESTADQGRFVAEKIRKAVERTSLVYADWKIKVTVSAGVGEVNTQSDNPETLVNRVDAALYQAKQNGRNRVELA